MKDDFEIRLRCAMVAGWRTLVICVAFFLIQWIMYLLSMAAQPDWVLTLWGPGATWQEIRAWWFWFLVYFKVFLLLIAFFLLWLTLWDRQLQKHTS